jgi:hypothetical protein
LTSSKPDEVSVDVLDQLIPGTATPTYSTIHQQRTYRLTGNLFTQVAGETTFQASLAGVTVTPSALTFAPPVAGCRIGTITLTIHNGGTAPAPDLSAVLIGSMDTGGDCPAPPGQGYESVMVGIGTLAAGDSNTITVPVVVSDIKGGASVEDSPYDFIYLRTGNRQYPGSTHYIVVYQ